MLAHRARTRDAGHSEFKPCKSNKLSVLKGQLYLECYKHVVVELDEIAAAALARGLVVDVNVEVAGVLGVWRNANLTVDFVTKLRFDVSAGWCFPKGGRY